MKFHFRDHPGIWFCTWSVIVLFLLGVWSGITQMSELITRPIIFFISSMCFFFMTHYHVQWLMKIDEREYKKQQEKEEHDAYRKLFTPVHPRLGERSWYSTLWERGNKAFRTIYEGIKPSGRD